MSTFTEINNILKNGLQAGQTWDNRFALLKCDKKVVEQGQIKGIHGYLMSFDTCQEILDYLEKNYIDKKFQNINSYINR